MKELSSIAAAIQPSATLAVNTLFKQMKADGLDVVGFGAGEPDFSTPSNISEAGVRAIEEGKTRYTPSAGIIHRSLWQAAQSTVFILPSARCATPAMR